MNPSALTAPPALKTLPVIEIFGPTIQGEGAEAGVPTHFLRLGGCDYRCAWCDTMYAVDPATVRATAHARSGEEIVEEILALDGSPRWVTVSGGNPALHDLSSVVDGLHDADFLVSVETQGSRWRPWLGKVDRLTVSPKPPSSGMSSPKHAEQVERFMAAALVAVPDRTVFKIVCFDEKDLQWAKSTAAQWPEVPVYLSAGTPVPTPPDIRRAVGERYRWLCERVALDGELSRARILPQLHVIAWEAATGV